MTNTAGGAQKKPRVSVVTIVWNNRNSLEDAMQSVFVQKYPDIEYIVVDGGSTDGTVDLIKANAWRIAKWVSEPDGGIYDAMNKGVRMATGEIVAILNSDDFYSTPAAVGTIVAAMEKTNADVGWGDIIYVSAKDTKKITRRWRSSSYSRGKFLCGWHPPHPAFFVRKKVYEKYGGFNTDLNIAADYEFMLRVLRKHHASSVYVPSTITTMRVGGASYRGLRNVLRLEPRSLRAEWRVFNEDRRAWKMNGLRGGLIAAVLKPIYKLPQLLL